MARVQLWLALVLLVEAECRSSEIIAMDPIGAAPGLAQNGRLAPLPAKGREQLPLDNAPARDPPPVSAPIRPNDPSGPTMATPGLFRREFLEVLRLQAE